jgi:hypothetical protein
MKKLVKGMHKDSERVDQPENTFRDALNANLYYSKGAIVNEQGTTQMGTWPVEVIGSIPLLNNQVIVFGWIDDTQTTIPAFDSTKSGILLVDTKKNSSRILYMNPNLNFQKDYPIVGEFRVDNKNDIIIYFTDNYSTTETIIQQAAGENEDIVQGPFLKNYNSPKAFNVTRQLDYVKNSAIALSYKNLYDDLEEFDTAKLDLFAKVGKHSLIEKVDIYEGGVLVSGAYHLALCYSDENFLETDYFIVSNPVYVFQSQEQQYPVDVITGCQSGSQTNKAIRFKVRTFKNNNYKFLQPTIIQRVGNAEFAYKLERIELQNILDAKQIDVVYTGTEDTASSSVDDIIIDNVGYLTAKALTQLDNRLYLANLKSRKDIGFQRYASQIKVRAITKSFDKFDVRVFDTISLNKGYAMMHLPYTTPTTQGAEFGIGQTFLILETGANENIIQSTNEDTIRRNYFEIIQSYLNYEDTTIGTGEGGVEVGYSLQNKIAKGYKDYRFSFKHKSFRRGEVYAFYISFILKDGTETYAYHIPGRKALWAKHSYNSYLNRSENSNFGAGPDVGSGSWQHIRDMFGFYPSEIASHNSDGRLYQYIDTSSLTLYPNQSAINQVSTNNMGFWANQHERYPETDDFLGGKVNSAGTGIINNSLDLRGEEVRHHRMPSNHNNNFSFIEYGDASYYGSDHTLLEENLQSSGAYLSENIGQGFDRAYNGNTKLVTKENIRLLGIQLEDLKIPKHILKKVQGYKIYYAKRKDDDKLVAGQSLAIPAHPRYASVPTQNKLLARRGPFKNAFYLFGGLEHTDANAMEISADWKKFSSASNTDRGTKYVGHPVFTFHDFNMLRKKPTLEGITHMSCQSAIVFRNFQGGPGVFEEKVSSSALTDGSGASQQGIEGATDVTSFPSLGWIHPDLGNTTDFSKDGEVVDVTDNFIDLQEDVSNPYGTTDSDGASEKKTGFLKRVFGKLTGKESVDDVADLVKVKDLQIHLWRTQVCIAAKHIRSGGVFAPLEFVKGGSNRGAWNNHWGNDQSYVVPNTQMVFRVDPKSKIYAQGQSNIQVPESTSFKGASVLYNRGGESSIALSLDSGLPSLKAFRLYSENFYSAGASGGTPWDLSFWGDYQEFCYPDAFYYERLPDYLLMGNQYGAGVESSGQGYFRGFKYSLNGPTTAFLGYPMAWLVNLESGKTDVYNPFDKQELVWTGYYKAIIPEERDLGDGTAEITGLDSGVCLDDYGEKEYNYYHGASSGEIFGGDTYITRHSFRTTSQSYGHSFFRAATDLNDPGSSHYIEGGGDAGDHNDFHIQGNNSSDDSQGHSADRFQSDIPDFLNPLHTSTWGLTNSMTVWAQTNTTDTTEERFSAQKSIINNTGNWVQGNSNPVSTLFSMMVESDDNIGLRHKTDTEKGVTTKYYDADVAYDVLFASPREDLTKQDNLLYNNNYSALNDLRTARPFPKRMASGDDITNFPNRVIRSKASGSTIGDKFRQFLANDYKDIPKNRGDIWSLFTLSGMLYIHAERSLFRTQGKENLSVGDVTAFIGSGNIFEQEPTEMSSASTGHGGTTSVFGGVNTPSGRYFISRRDRKIFSITEGLTEAMEGMEGWFRDNIPFRIEEYGIDVDADDFPFNPDSTVAAAPMGFTITYDPKYKRIVLTKKEPIPTAIFIEFWERGSIEIINNAFVLVGGCNEYTDPEGPGEDGRKAASEEDSPANAADLYCGVIGLANPTFFSQRGWTVSYYPELQVWGSRHSYLPKLYVSTAESMFSFNTNYMWAHDNLNNPGNFYGTVYPFEIDFIDNSEPGNAKMFSSVSYWIDIKKKDTSYTTEYESKTNPGFTSFYVYNTRQVSAISTNLYYLNNVRRVDQFWYINSFRDLAKYTDQTNTYINSGQPTVVDTYINTINEVTSSEPMFTTEGTVNGNYIDSTKPWHMQKKFVDHYLGVRLSNDNTSTNLVYLYAIGSKFRKSNR